MNFKFAKIRTSILHPTFLEHRLVTPLVIGEHAQIGTDSATTPIESDISLGPANDFSTMDCEVMIMAILERTYSYPHIYLSLRPCGFTVNVKPDMNGSIAYAVKYFCESLRSLGLIFPQADLTGDPGRSDSSTLSSGDRLTVTFPLFVQDVVPPFSKTFANLTILDGRDIWCG